MIEKGMVKDEAWTYESVTSDMHHPSFLNREEEREWERSQKHVK